MRARTDMGCSGEPVVPGKDANLLMEGTVPVGDLDVGDFPELWI